MLLFVNQVLLFTLCVVTGSRGHFKVVAKNGITVNLRMKIGEQYISDEKKRTKAMTH